MDQTTGGSRFSHQLVHLRKSLLQDVGDDVVDIAAAICGQGDVDRRAGSGRRPQAVDDQVPERSTRLVHDHESDGCEMPTVRHGHLDKTPVLGLHVLPAHTCDPPRSEGLRDAGPMQEERARVREAAPLSGPRQSRQIPLASAEATRMQDDDTGKWLLPPAGLHGTPDAVLANTQDRQLPPMGHGLPLRTHRSTLRFQPWGADPSSTGGPLME